MGSIRKQVDILLSANSEKMGNDDALTIYKKDITTILEQLKCVSKNLESLQTILNEILGRYRAVEEDNCYQTPVGERMDLLLNKKNDPSFIKNVVNSQDGQDKIKDGLENGLEIYLKKISERLSSQARKSFGIWSKYGIIPAVMAGLDLYMNMKEDRESEGSFNVINETVISTVCDLVPFLGTALNTELQYRYRMYCEKNVDIEYVQNKETYNATEYKRKHKDEYEYFNPSKNTGCVGVTPKSQQKKSDDLKSKTA